MPSKKRTRSAGARVAREREMRRVVRDQERSGLSQRQFCELLEMPLSTLTWWRRRLGKARAKRAACPDRKGRGAFFEVEVVDDTRVSAPASTPAAPIEVCLAEGTVIRVPHDVPEATLCRLISLARSSC